MKLVTNITSSNNTNIKEDVVFVEEKNLKKIINFANKHKINRILYKNETEEFVLMKINRIWKTIENFVWNLSVINRYNLSFDNSFKDLFKINIFSNEYQSTIKNGRIEFENNLNIESLKIDFLLEEDFKNKIYENNHISIKTKLIDKKNNDKIQNFKEKLNKKISLPGIDFDSIKENDKRTIYKTKKGFFSFINNETNVTIIVVGQRENLSESDFYANSLINNINNNIFQIKNSNPKLSLKNILGSLAGFLLVILISYLTFDKIFGTGGLNSSFDILSSTYTWTQIWIYIIIANFITTFLFTFVAVFVFSVIIQKQKPNWKTTRNFFISSQIRTICLFLTGNLIVSTFIWGLYLNKTSNIRTSSLIATFGLANLIKSITLLFNSLIFMVPASVYLWNEFESIDQALLINGLSYGGVLYTVIQDSLISILIMFPLLHPLYIKMKILISFKGRYTFESLKTANNDVESLNIAVRPMFKDWNRIFRIFITSFILVIFEAIETSSVFQMCENYSYHISEFEGIPFMENHATYFNFFPIAGSRMMSNYVRHFPLINLIPGQGVGITDFFLKSTNEIIIAKQHLIPISEIKNYNSEISSIATRITFITRFFNFYLTRIIALIITIYSIFKIILIKNNKKR